jgi:hypothetical protein
VFLYHNKNKYSKKLYLFDKLLLVASYLKLFSKFFLKNSKQTETILLKMIIFLSDFCLKETVTNILLVF